MKNQIITLVITAVNGLFSAQPVQAQLYSAVPSAYQNMSTPHHSQEKTQAVFSTRFYLALDHLGKLTTSADYYNMAREFADAASTEKGNWLYHYYTAYCYARTAMLSTTGSEQITRYCAEGTRHARIAQKILSISGDKRALSEVYTVASMLYWKAGQAARAAEETLPGNYAYRYLAMARAYNNCNPRAVYWDAFMKVNQPQEPGDTLLGRDIAALVSRLPQTTKTGWPNWGIKESHELLNR